MTRTSRASLPVLAAVLAAALSPAAQARGPAVQAGVSAQATAPTPAPAPAPAAPAPRTYTVVSGDTLWAIAERFYGDGNQYPKIASASGVANPDLIHPGQVLTIPD